MALKMTIDSNVREATDFFNENVEDATSALGSTFNTLQDVASKGIYLGVGLAAMISENIGAFVHDTVKYGERVEKRQMRMLSNLSSEAVDRVKDVFGYGKNTYRRAEKAFEDTLDDVVDELEIPRKSDLRTINRKLNEIKHNTEPKKAAKRGNGKAHKAALSTAKRKVGTAKRKAAGAAKKAAHKTTSKRSKSASRSRSASR